MVHSPRLWVLVGVSAADVGRSTGGVARGGGGEGGGGQVDGSDVQRQSHGICNLHV